MVIRKRDVGNLFHPQYVGNNPTNKTDPRGLQGEQIVVKDIGKKADLKDATIKFKQGDVQGQGTITASTDATITNRKGKDITGYGTFSFVSDVPLDNTWHWLQFGAYTAFDKEGNVIEDFFPVRKLSVDQEPRTIYYKSGDRYVDILIIDKSKPPFVDVSAPSNTRKLPKELTIVDKPGITTDPRVNGQSFTLDTYLVHGKDVVYHVSWSVTALRTKPGEYAFDQKILPNESGKLNRIPAFLAAKECTGGFQKLVGGKVLTK